MANNYLGVSKHNLENGSRIIMPPRFREKLSPEFVLFKSPDGCISIYDIENFDEILKQARLLATGKEGRAKARTVTRAARYMSLDKQGRFTIPADYIAYASLGDTVYLTGEANRIEIWSEQDYIAQGGEEELTEEMFPDIKY